MDSIPGQEVARMWREVTYNQSIENNQGREETGFRHILKRRALSVKATGAWEAL